MFHVKHNLSSPIAIPVITTTNNINDQYSTNNSCFGPLHNSPPSVWKSRLNKRLGGSPIKHEYLGIKK